MCLQPPQALRVLQLSRDMALLSVSAQILSDLAEDEACATAVLNVNGTRSLLARCDAVLDHSIVHCVVRALLLLARQREFRAEILHAQEATRLIDMLDSDHDDVVQCTTGCLQGPEDCAEGQTAAASEASLHTSPF